MTASLADTERFFSLLARPGDVFELRGLVRVNGQQHVTTGFFDDVAELVRAAVDRSGKDDGVYVTINPVNPALLARAPKNKLRRAGSGDTTSDRDVRQRRSILIDVDPVRPTGISSTDIEHSAAIVMARSIRDELTGRGWPLPILADSGNGAHLIYAVDLPVDDGGTVKRVLEQLGKRYSTSTLKVDEKVFNPARISKIYGTLTRKGEDTPDRPHRLARIIEAPEVLDLVPREHLAAFAPEAPKNGRPTPPRVPSADRPEFDLDTFIADHLPGAKERTWSEGRKWILAVCPFNDSHDRGEAFVTQFHSGAVSAGCLHDSCRWGWRELRSHFDPTAYQFAAGSNGHRLTDREPPPEVLYEDRDYEAELDAFADRDREPAQQVTPPAAPAWKRGPDLVDVVWAAKDEPWVSLMLGPDELIRVRTGGIVVFMGGPGSGKSSLVSNLLVNHARDVGPAIALSIELPADELAARIAGIRCDASWEDTLRGQVSREHLTNALSLPRLFVIEREQATLENLRRCVEAARAEYPGQPIMCAVDYAQIIASERDEARQKVTDVFERLDRSARSMRYVMLAVSQMGRQGAKAARDGDRLGVDTQDLGAESAAIERFASVTVTIGKGGEVREDGSRAFEVSIGKVRMGIGDQVRVMTFWGRSGLWRAAGEALSASKVREQREVDKAEAEERIIADCLVRAAERCKEPISREELIALIKGTPGNATKKGAAIQKLVNASELVEVARRRPRSRSFLIMHPDRARDAGIMLRHDMPTQGEM